VTELEQEQHESQDRSGGGGELQAALAALERFMARARRRLLIIVGTFLTLVMVAFFAGERFLEELLAVQPRLSSLVFLSPAEALVSQFKLALGAGRHRHLPPSSSGRSGSWSGTGPGAAPG